MNAFVAIWRRFRSLGQSREAKREIDEELRFHLEQRTTANIAAGMPPGEAAREARKRFGNLQSVREECRDVRRANLGETLCQDIRFGARMLRKNPGFTLVAVLTLALGIGANAAIFSLVNAILMRPLPYQESERLVKISFAYPEFDLHGSTVSPVGYDYCHDHATSLANVGAAGTWFPILTGRSQPERLAGMKVTASLFPTLCVNAFRGRVFLPEEDKAGASRSVVISYPFWKREFDADPDAVGKTLTLDGDNYTIVGILPSGFKLPGEPDVFTMPAFTDAFSHTEFLSVVGRLKPGMTLEQARAEMNTLAEADRGELFGGSRQAGIEMTGLREALVGNIRPALMIVTTVVAVVLLIGCLNVANLLLARAAGRQKEIAVRMALGASQLRLVRQMLTESLLLSLLGGAAGLLMSFFALGAMQRIVPSELAQLVPDWQHVQIDAHVLGFTLAVSLLTGIIFGLAPAFQAAWVSLNEAVKESGRGATGGRCRHRLRSLFVVTELALAIVLLVGAGLLVRSFSLVQKVDPGFRPDHVLTFRLTLPEYKYGSSAQITAFCSQLVEKLNALPGVTSAGLGLKVPLDGLGMTSSFQIEGRDTAPDQPGPHGAINAVDPGYFATLGIPLIEGRCFTTHDNATGAPVVIVDEKVARQYWPNESALGRRVRINADAQQQDGQPVWREIVGVVGHVKINGLDSEAKEQCYLPQLQSPFRFFSPVIRTKMNPEAFTRAVQGEVWSLDKDLPVSGIQTMDDLMRQSLTSKRDPMLLVSLFALLALLLAAMGLHGVISYSMGQRTHEFGIRMALGAQPSDVLRLALGQAMWLVLLGTTIGIAGALALTHLLSRFLFGVSPTDPMTLGGATVVLALVALAASYFPARRATKADPMTALRCE